MSDEGATSPESLQPPVRTGGVPSSIGVPSYVEGFSVAPIAEPRSPEKTGDAGQTPEPSTLNPQEPLPVTASPAQSVSNPEPPTPVASSPVTLEAVAQPAPQPVPEPAPDQTAAVSLPVASSSESPFAPAAAQKPVVVRPRSGWQPFTFQGVMSFAYTSGDRLLFIQLMMAVIVGVTVLWFADRNYSPVIVAAIRNMPETAAIRGGTLEGVTHGTLATQKFLSIAVDLEQGGLGQIGDVQLELHPQFFAICPMFRSLAGIGRMRYPGPGFVGMGRTELEARWEAWRPMLYAGVVLSVALILLLTWILLSTLYAIPARLFGYFGDRAVDLGQAWKLAGAALMPGALMMEIAIILYGLQWVDLVGLSVLTVLHLIVGWVYVGMGTLRLPKIAKSADTANPFTS